MSSALSRRTRNLASSDMDLQLWRAENGAVSGIANDYKALFMAGLPFIIGVSSFIISFATGIIPTSALNWVLLAVIGLGYGTIGIRFVILQGEGPGPVINALVRETEDLEWPAPLIIKKYWPIFRGDEKLNEATYGRMSKVSVYNKIGSSGTAMNGGSMVPMREVVQVLETRPVYAYGFRFENEALPLAIIISPFVLSITHAKEITESNSAAAFVYTRTRIYFHSFPIKVDSTFATFMFRKHVQTPSGEMLPVYELIDSNGHVHLRKQDIAVPLVQPKTVDDVVDSYFKEENAVLRTENEALRQELRMKEETQEDNWATSKKIAAFILFRSAEAKVGSIKGLGKVTPGIKRWQIILAIITILLALGFTTLALSLLRMI